MRRSILIATIAVTLLSAGALAAPTCQNEIGETVRCGTPGAMPVGWTLPVELRAGSQTARAVEPHQLLEVLFALAGFFALLSLMPDFEGDWDEEGRDG
jgi:hypothetical protein